MEAKWSQARDERGRVNTFRNGKFQSSRYAADLGKIARYAFSSSFADAAVNFVKTTERTFDEGEKEAATDEAKTQDGSGTKSTQARWTSRVFQGLSGMR